MYTVTFVSQKDGMLARVQDGGLVCNEFHANKITSKELASLLLESLLEFIGNHDFKSGSIKVMVLGKPILIISEKTLELTSTSQMSLYDEWVFMHLQNLWKERKI